MVLKLLNQQPMYNNLTDFSRVRNYLLAEDSVKKNDKNGENVRQSQSQYRRQLIISSKFIDPALLSSFRRYSKSISGQIKLRRKIRDEDSSVSKVVDVVVVPSSMNTMNSMTTLKQVFYYY